jgi:hypothetical protein
LIDQDEQPMGLELVVQSKLCGKVKAALFVLRTCDERGKRSYVRRDLLIIRKGDLQVFPWSTARPASDQWPPRALRQVATLDSGD